MKTTTKGCIVKPPPQPPQLERVECEYTICLDKENAAALALWASEVNRWAQDAWTLCKGHTND